MGREDVTVFVMALAGMISTLVLLATVWTPAVFMVLIPIKAEGQKIIRGNSRSVTLNSKY